MLRYQTRFAPAWQSALRKIRKQRIKEMTKIPNRLHKYVPSMLLFRCLKQWQLRCGSQRTIFLSAEFHTSESRLGLGTALFTAGKRYSAFRPVGGGQLYVAVLM